MKKVLAILTLGSSLCFAQTHEPSDCDTNLWEETDLALSADVQPDISSTLVFPKLSFFAQFGGNPKKGVRLGVAVGFLTGRRAVHNPYSMKWWKCFHWISSGIPELFLRWNGNDKPLLQANSAVSQHKDVHYENKNS